MPLPPAPAKPADIVPAKAYGKSEAAKSAAAAEQPSVQKLPAAGGQAPP